MSVKPRRELGRQLGVEILARRPAGLPSGVVVAIDRLTQLINSEFIEAGLAFCQPPRAKRSDAGHVGRVGRLRLRNVADVRFCDTLGARTVAANFCRNTSIYKHALSVIRSCPIVVCGALKALARGNWWR
jgi:hypothetical protein